MKVISAAVAFGYNVLLARMLGADNVGIYFISFTIVSIASTVSRFGLDNTVVRYVSIARTKNDYPSLYGVYKKAVFITTVLSIFVTLLIEVFSDWISENVFAESGLTIPLKIMALSITPLSLFMIHASVLQGMKRARQYIAVLSFWLPLFASVGALFFIPYYGVNGAVAAYVFGSIFTLFISYKHWRNAVKKRKSRASKKFKLKVLVQSCYPMFISSILRMFIERSSVIFLGMWVTSKDVGVYSAAYRMAMLTSFVLVAVNSVSAPIYASLYDQGRLDELEQCSKATAKLLMLVSTPIMMVFVFYSEFLMSMFGEQFIEGSLLLVILSCGQYINLITGPVGYLLIMSGHERIMRNNLIFSTILCLLLNLVLVKEYGLLGASIATAITIAIQNLISTVLVKKYLGFFIFPFFSKHRVQSNG